MKKTSPIVFLVDVDDTLLDNGRVQADLKKHIAVKQAWGERVTTVFPRQGEFALNPVALASYPPADVSVERISDLLEHDLSDLLLVRERSANTLRPSVTAPPLN